VDNSAAQKIVLGSITGLFGIRGWVKVFSETDPRENIVNYRQWWIKKNQHATEWRQVRVLEGRRQGKTVIVSLDGVDNPEVAETLVGQIIAVDRAQLPALGEGEFYWADLVGHEVVNQRDEIMGRVDRLFSTGANDVLVVTTQAAVTAKQKSDPAAEVLIPWILGSVILDVDHPARRIQVDWELDY